MSHETVFTYGAPQLKFGRGASDEVGFDLGQYDARRVLVVTDAGVAAAGHAARVAERIAEAGIEVVVFDRVHVEPTDESLEDAVAWARDEGPWDAFVAVGGGSSIDTAKAVNLLTSNPGGAPRLRQRPRRQGAGAAASPEAVGRGADHDGHREREHDHLRPRRPAAAREDGISTRGLRPTLAVVDPLLTMSQPAGVTAAAGMDILCHALESWTARPFSSYDRKKPEQRVPYCGANPVADMWAEKAMSLLASSFRRAVTHGDGEEAREQMALAATFAGMGFGNAGVHPARERLPDRRAGQGLPAERLPRRRADGAPRDGGVADRAGGVPLHVRRRPGPPRARRPVLAPGAERTADARDLLPDVLRTLMATSRSPTASPPSATTRATSVTSSRVP